MMLELLIYLFYDECCRFWAENNAGCLLFIKVEFIYSAGWKTENMET